MRLKIQNVDFPKERFELLNRKDIPKSYYEERKYLRNGIGKKYAFSLDNEVRRIAYICNNCFSELYGEWNYPSFYYEPENDERHPNFSHKSQVDSSKETAEAYKELLSDMKKWEVAKIKLKEDRDAIHNDIRKFCETKVCPVCGAPIDFFTGISYKTDNFNVSQSFNYKYSTYRNDKNYEVYRSIPTKGIDKDFEYLYTLCNPVTAKVDTLIAEINSKSDVFVTTEVSKQKIDTIVNDKKLLKDYILNLCNLENSIYSLNLRLEKIYREQILNNSDILGEEYVTKKSVNDEYKAISEKISSFNKNPSFSFDDFKVSIPKKTEPAYPIAPVMPQEPVLEKAGLFNKKHVSEANALKMKMYEQQMAVYREEKEHYSRAIEKYNQDVVDSNIEYQRKLQEAKMLQKLNYENALKKHNENVERTLTPLKSQLCILADKKAALDNNISQIPTASKGAKAVLEKEMSEAEALLQQLYLCRNQLYSYDIVFIKYRDAIALSTFYEYLSSGRCETLEGVNGAYNLYENECRANKIISQLSQVINSLEQIKNNQFMIYQELKSINNNLNALNDKMSQAVKSIKKIESNTTDMSAYLKQVAENTDVIAYNTEKTAYYSKLSAQLTNSLGYMVAFK